MIATITRWVEVDVGGYEEEFSVNEVESFEDALAICEKSGNLAGLIADPGVKFLEIDEETMSATFEILNRLRYLGDKFYLNVSN
jgi:hypothetical protein